MTDQTVPAGGTVRKLGARGGDIAVQGPVRRQPRHLEAELVEPHRLGQVVERPFLQHRHRVSHGGVAGHQDHVGVRRLRPQPPEQRHPVDVGKAHVRQHQIVGGRGGRLQRRRAVFHAGDLMSLVDEGVGDQGAQIGFVVDDQDKHRVHNLGLPCADVQTGIDRFLRVPPR